MDSRLSYPGTYPPLSSSSTLSLPLTLSFLIHCYPTLVVWLSLFHWSVHPSSVPVLLAFINLLLSCLSFHLLSHDPLWCITFSTSTSSLFKHPHFFSFFAITLVTLLLFSAQFLPEQRDWTGFFCWLASKEVSALLILRIYWRQQGWHRKQRLEGADTNCIDCSFHPGTSPAVCSCNGTL